MTKKTEQKMYVITMVLTEGRTCRFEYSEERLAKEQYLYYTTVGVINNQIIKKISLE